MAQTIGDDYAATAELVHTQETQKLTQMTQNDENNDHNHKNVVDIDSNNLSIKRDVGDDMKGDLKSNRNYWILSFSLLIYTMYLIMEMGHDITNSYDDTLEYLRIEISSLVILSFGIFISLFYYAHCYNNNYNYNNIIWMIGLILLTIGVIVYLIGAGFEYDEDYSQESQDDDSDCEHLFMKLLKCLFWGLQFHYVFAIIIFGLQNYKPKIFLFEQDWRIFLLSFTIFVHFVLIVGFYTRKWEESDENWNCNDDRRRLVTFVTSGVETEWYDSYITLEVSIYMIIVLSFLTCVFCILKRMSILKTNLKIDFIFGMLWIAVFACVWVSWSIVIDSGSYYLILTQILIFIVAFDFMF